MPDSNAQSELVTIEHLVNEPLVGDVAFGSWHDMTRPVFDVGHLEPRPDYRIESEWFVVDGLILTQVDFGASTYRRKLVRAVLCNCTLKSPHCSATS